ncbi:MAG: V-type ATP synthase subunit K [Deltaproteobacteria bacterium]|nr:V-type ATP synthase subunit K [Deltaproteobacteria bacterium]
MDASGLGIAAAGAALAISAAGSALGTGFAGMSAIGAWKKCFAQEKTAPFILIAFVGAPLSQTIYGFILMNSIFQTAQKFAASDASTSFYIFLVLAGLFGGIGIGASAAMQGKAGAAAADALAETGKGFGNYIMVVGIIETVALFTMIFLMVTMGKIG